jgi:microcystin-dependent protein
MSEPFIAEIRIFAGNFAPRGWAFCNGQLLPIAQNTALFSLLGTTYGGDGRTTMGLPNLQGRAPMHPGQGAGLTPRRLGEAGGSDAVTLVGPQLPRHDHFMRAAPNTAQASPSDSVGLGNAPMYATPLPGNVVPMADEAVGAAGGGRPHENRQPFLALSFIIALQGLYPSRW